jgi:hypothetical protein
MFYTSLLSNISVVLKTVQQTWEASQPARPSLILRTTRVSGILFYEPKMAMGRESLILAFDLLTDPMSF